MAALTQPILFTYHSRASSNDPEDRWKSGGANVWRFRGLKKDSKVLLHSAFIRARVQEKKVFYGVNGTPIVIRYCASEPGNGGYEMDKKLSRRCFLETMGVVAPLVQSAARAQSPG